MTWEEFATCTLCKEKIGQERYYEYSVTHGAFFHISCLMAHSKECSDDNCDCVSIIKEFRVQQ